MADIRINALATTAASTASDDFLAVDGSSQGTRKLSAYSPTFGGNLTVSGTGDSSFAGKLSVRNTAADGVSLALNQNNSGSAGWNLSASNAGALNIARIGGNTAVSYDLNGNSTFFTSGTQTFGTGVVTGNLTVSGTGNNVFNTGGGNFGIGAASPSGKLTVYGGQTEWGATSSLGFLGYTGGNPIVGAIGALSLLLYTNGAEAGRITSGGYVGIATTDVQAKLHVRGSSSDPILRIGYNVAGQSYLDVYRTSVDAVPNIQGGYGGSTFPIAIQANGGNFLLGTTTDGGQKLQVSGTAAITSSLAIGNASTAGPYRLVLDGSGGVGNVSVIQFKNGGATKGYVGLAGGYLGTTSTDMLISTDVAGAAIQFIPGDSAITALTLDSSRNATFAGTIASKSITVNPGTTATSLVLKSSQAGSYGWQFIQDEASTGNFFIQRLVASTASDVLTLDRSNGNATFAGTISPQQAATASAPTYVKGAIYFDTTLNKLRVGGATGWETITSV